MSNYHITQEQARKIAIDQGFVVSREDSPLMLEMLHAFANAVLDKVLGEHKVREQTALECLEIVKQNTYEPDPYNRTFDEENAAYKKAEEIYDDIKRHFKIKPDAIERTKP